MRNGAKYLNGLQIARHTTLGRYLCFSAIETKTWAERELAGKKLHRMSRDHLNITRDKLSLKFHNMHASLASIIKTLMTSKPAVKERVLQWLRSAVGLNMDLRKMMPQRPVASFGFVLNFVDLLLLLCQPFTGAFDKYSLNIERINCTYLTTDTYVAQASSLDKIEINPERVKDLRQYLLGELWDELRLSGLTAAKVKEPPHFITECFFMVHILISFGHKRLDQFYKKNNQSLTEAFKKKD
jgi:hypothetical protein